MKHEHTALRKRKTIMKIAPKTRMFRGEIQLKEKKLRKSLWKASKPEWTKIKHKSIQQM